MSEARDANPLVEQFRKGGVPRELRLVAAQGALPLKLEDLLELLTHLLHDVEPMVSDAAGRTLAGYPAPELLEISRSKLTTAPVLTWLVTNRPERELRENCLQNPSLPDEAIQVLAPSLSQELAELVVINQTRLLRRTTLLEALESNPSLNNDQKRRLRELRETFRIGEQPATGPPLVATTPSPPPPPDEPELAPVDLGQPSVEEEGEISEPEALVRYLTEDERHQTEKVSAVQKIYRLTMAEKVITALKGNREDRAILIRDPNRLISTAVLGSPRLTDSEVEAFAAMRSVSHEVLRQIAAHREWVKRYEVLSALVKNPRTPVGLAMPLVARLRPRDMKAVGVDRNVPEVIRRHAQKFIKAAAEGTKR